MMQNLSLNSIQNSEQCFRVSRNWRTTKTNTPPFFQSGLFLVTLCSYQLNPLFGHVAKEKSSFEATELGTYLEQIWQEFPQYSSDISIGEFVLMPNHLHGILEFGENLFIDKKKISPVVTRVSLFKSGATRKIRERINQPNKKIWSPGYHIYKIQSEEKLQVIRSEIAKNIQKWNKDCFFRA